MDKNRIRLSAYRHVLRQAGHWHLLQKNIRALAVGEEILEALPIP